MKKLITTIIVLSALTISVSAVTPKLIVPKMPKIPTISIDWNAFFGR